MGQGANMAFEDATSIARCIATNTNLQDAFKVHNKRIPRTTKIVELSQFIGKIGMVQNPIICWFRDTMMVLMSKLSHSDADRDSWVYDYECI